MEENKDQELEVESVPTKSKVWLAGADGLVALLQGVIGGGALTYYFTRIRGLSSDNAAIVLILFGIWNMVNDPLFGYITDATRSKLGRRIPYIRYGAPLIALSYILCWFSWPGDGDDQALLFAQFLIFLLFYDTLYTVVATSLWIMPFEMAVSNKVRGSIFLWKILFSLIATVIPLVAIPILQPDVGEDTTFYQTFHIVLGVVVGLVVYFSTFFYKEKGYVQEEESMPFLESLKVALKNIPFLIFEVISFTIIFVQSNLMFGVLYYYDEIDVPMIPTFAALFLGALGGAILFVKKIKGWGVKKCKQYMMALFASGSLMILFFGRYTIPTTIGFFGIGVGFAGGYYLVPMMMGDTIDYDEEKTGLRREGIYSGVNSFLTKYGISIAQASFLWIIDGFGYNQDLPKGTQSARAETGILVAWMLIPAILLIICFIILKWYPLAGKKWQKTKEKIAQRHMKKEKEHLEKLGFKYQPNESDTDTDTDTPEPHTT